jgi:zinc protease
VLAGSAAYLIANKPPVPPAPAPPAKDAAAAPAEEKASEAPPAKPEAPKVDAASAVWPQDASDIPADPRATFGKLPNGLRYIILPNKEPQKRVSLRIHIASGALEERDDQRGLAHFMEHMVFNGTKHYKAGLLVPIMQRLGIGFGAHVNAYTSFDETVYMLDLPDLSDATMDLGFNVMRDFGDGATLEEAQIDRERGVILSEKTSRDSVQFRLMEQQFNTLLSGSLIARRFPIGKEEIIKTAQRDRFVDFYTHYYTPERMTFVVVGDIDPQVMEAKIKETFGSMTNPSDPGKNPDLGKIVPPVGVEPEIFSDKEVASTELGMVSVRPFEKVLDTKERRLSLLPLELAHAIVDRRFERLAKQDGSPITGGGMSREQMFNHAELGSVDVSVANDRWQDALPVMEQEFRRALEFGFTDAEVAEAKANVLNSYEQAVKTASTRKSDALASAIAKSINSGEVLTAPETDLEIVKDGLATITAGTCHEAFHKFWDGQGIHLTLTAKEAPANGKAELLEIYNASHSKPVTAAEQAKVSAFGYTDFGPAGSVKSRNEIPDLEMVQFVLSNGVRLNFKKTDFEKNKIRLLARIGTGKLSQPAKSPGLDMFSTAIYDGGGLGKHSVDDLQRILAGKNVGDKFAVGEDAFTQTGATTPEDMELQLQLMCAELTDPGYRPEALSEFRKQVPVIFQTFKHSPQGAQAGMTEWLHGGDARWTFPDEPKLMSYTIDDTRKWLAPQLAKGYLELSIVGDIDEETLLPLVLKTYGALPARDEARPDDSAARKVAFPKAPATKAITYDSKIPQGTAFVIWKTEGIRGNQKLFRRLNLVAKILGDMLREEVRQKMGASYSPNAGASGSDALDGYGFVLSQCVGTPEDAQKLADTAARLGSEFAAKGVVADDLERARRPVLADLEKTKRDNTYWLGTVLAQSQEDPSRLDLVRNRDTDYPSITLEEINKLAKTYLGDKNALKVIIKNEEKK